MRLEYLRKEPHLHYGNLLSRVVVSPAPLGLSLFQKNVMFQIFELRYWKTGPQGDCYVSFSMRFFCISDQDQPFNLTR